MHDWVRAGYLIPVLRRVYAVGHTAESRDGDLWAAVLNAGPGAELSHVTAVHWRGLVNFPGPLIHVSTPRSCASPPGIVVHGRRAGLVRERVKGMPVTTIAQTALDIAATTSDLVLVRKLLAELEYQNGGLDFAQLRAACGRGRRGSAALALALQAHDPRLARTNGPLELRFYVFCEARVDRGIPLPQPGALVFGVRVDAYFPDHALVVELDGEANHRTPAQRRRDRRNELILRSHGIEVVRYDWPLVEREPDRVEEDLLAILARRAERGRKR